MKVNQASLLTADIETSNGVIHVIDQVLLPPTPKNDIAGVAEKAGNFNTLLAAMEVAGLGEALTGSKPLTVLAPTDAAFAALPKGTVESLLKPQNQSKLKDILLYHVISGSVSAGDALNAKKAQTLGGQKVGFAIKNGKFMVNGSTIVTTDIACDNGVIHVIDAVLLPESKKVTASCGTGTMQQMTASRRIEQAISMGVPVFNHGNHTRCSEIYMNCVRALANDHQLCEGTRNSLVSLADRASKMHCRTERSWALRRGLDQVYASIGQ